MTAKLEQLQLRLPMHPVTARSPINYMIDLRLAV